MAAIEVTSPDVESAISQGLAQLKLIRAEVKIEVLDEGSRGVLGIGSRPARVRLTPFAELEAARAASAASSTPEPKPAAEPIAPPTPKVTQTAAPSAPAPVAPPVTLPASNDDVDAVEDEQTIEIEGAELAASMTEGVLERMGIGSATCTSRSLMPSDEHDHPSVWVDVDFEPNDEGDDDVAALTAFQNEGWNALQTVVQTMWSHQTKSSIRVTIDINGLRARRQSQVQNMATRMAERVIATGKAITLEPMPAAERRLVHMALRDHPQVFTESTGEGNGRKVTIKIKK